MGIEDYIIIAFYGFCLFFLLCGALTSAIEFVRDKEGKTSWAIILLFSAFFIYIIITRIIKVIS